MPDRLELGRLIACQCFNIWAIYLCLRGMVWDLDKRRRFAKAVVNIERDICCAICSGSFFNELYLFW
jgi:hypothetical protein